MKKFWTTGERILRLLPATSRELRDELGIGAATLHKWLTRLRDPKNQKIRICGWQRTTGDLAPVYGLGKTEDCKRLKPRTMAEIQAKYIQGLRKAGLYEDYLADMRQYGARYRQRRGQKGYKPEAFDPLLKMFYRKI